MFQQDSSLRLIRADVLASREDLKALIEHVHQERGVAGEPCDLIPEAASLDRLCAHKCGVMALPPDNRPQRQGACWEAE